MVVINVLDWRKEKSDLRVVFAGFDIYSSEFLINCHLSMGAYKTWVRPWPTLWPTLNLLFFAEMTKKKKTNCKRLNGGIEPFKMAVVQAHWLGAWAE